MATVARPRIALIDDDATLLGLLRDLLEGFEGYAVLVCDQGDGAYEFVKTHRPDLVLLDVWMHGNEVGWTILERLTCDPETRPIPVIVCSAALDDFPDREPLLRRPGVDVLPKPFDLDALLAKVKLGLGIGRG